MAIRLNEAQRAAVEHDLGPLLVLAGAGSGKTGVVTQRIARLVERGVPARAILAMTFTNKAAGEMRHRLESILGDEVTRELWIGTFHAVCVRLIRRYHEAIGISPRFVIYDDSDQKAVMKRVLGELSLDDKRFPPAQILSRISREKQEARGPDDMSVDDYMGEITKRCYRAYQARLQSSGAADFDDLLLMVLRLAEDPKSESAEHLRRRFSHVLVDEFQDVNLVQYRLVRALAGDRRNICVVGDDDQSIYAWRGADVRNIRGFTRDYADARMVKLEQNYRSSKNVVGAALGVIRRARERQPKELWTANDDGARVRIVHCANERDEAAFVVDGVKRAIAAGTSPRDIAVFYRVHAQSRVLEEVMRHENVPYQIVGGTKFFDRAEIKDMLAYLRVIMSPQSDVDLLRIINRPARKIGNKTIKELQALTERQRLSVWDAIEPLIESDRLGSAANKALRDFAEMMQRFMKQAATASPRQLTEDVLADSGYAEYLQKQDNAEADARLDNLKELLGSMTEYEEEVAFAGETPSLEDYITRVSLMADADTMEEVPRVPMMTVHAAKGLEFDAVFMTGLEERLFPLRGQEPGEASELEEERRLAYVAITRARRDLYITHTNVRTIYGQLRYNEPARFLVDIPPEHQERVHTRALGDLSRSFTRGQQIRTRDLVHAGRADLPGMRRRRSLDDEESPFIEMPTRSQGERYVEMDEHVEYDASEGFDSFTLRVGAKVRHSKFGVGSVREIAGGSDPVCVVRFEGWGDKRIKLSFLSPA